MDVLESVVCTEKTGKSSKESSDMDILQSSMRTEKSGQSSKITHAASTLSNFGKREALLEVHDVNFTVDTKTGPRRILQNISFFVDGGKPLAMMGPSGAGKTTLLEILTLSLKGNASGEVLLNGKTLDFDTFRTRAAFVEQYDHHRAFLSCREILAFASKLCIRDAAEARKKVDDLLNGLGLRECAGTRAGNLFIKGISGGQKKRLSMGMNLLKRPDVLFLDEPTSGLDASSSEHVMSSLRDIAKEMGTIILATIHQPSTKVFMLFDNVLFLAGGRIAYFGSTASVENYCNRIGHPVPSMTNPADHFLEMISSEFLGRGKVDEVVDAWPTVATSTLPKPVIDVFEDQRRPSLPSQCLAMLHRQLVLCVRDPTIYVGRAFLFLVCNSFFALVYIKQRDRAQTYVQDKAFLAAWFLGPIAMFSIAIVYACNEEFKMTKKDIKNGLGSFRSTLVAQVVMQVAFMFVLSLCATIIPINGLGNYAIEGFPAMFLLMAIYLWCFEALGEVCALVHDNPLVGMLVYVQIWFTNFLFAGLFLSPDYVPWPLRAICYAVALRWGLRAAVYIEFSNGGDFDGAQLVYSSSTNTTVLQCSDPVYCYGVTGPQILDSLSKYFGVFSGDDTTILDMLIIFGMGVLYKVVYIVLVIIKTRKRSIKMEGRGLDKATILAYRLDYEREVSSMPIITEQEDTLQASSASTIASI